MAHHKVYTHKNVKLFINIYLSYTYIYDKSCFQQCRMAYQKAYTRKKNLNYNVDIFVIIIIYMYTYDKNCFKLF